MFETWGQVVVRRWPWIILAWVALALAVRNIAPPWDSVTRDGDLAFLPSYVPSALGEQLTREAFPATRAKSEFVLVISRTDRKFDGEDLRVVDQLASRFHCRLGVADFSRAKQAAADDQANRRRQLESALAAFDEAVKLDESNATAWHDRGILLRELGRIPEAQVSLDTAWRLEPQLRGRDDQLLPRDALDWPIAEVWNRHHEVFGTKLRSADKQAAIIIVKIVNEFMATDNIRVLRLFEQEVEAFRRQHAASGLEFGISGSAAVGGDMLSAAVESIRSAEFLTITLVVAILLIVYRAPLVALVPVLTIGVSLSVSIGLLSLLTRLDTVPGFSWWGFKVFKTTRIFIVVLLYGAGTDFCLFLFARLREELARGGDARTGLSRALARVGGTVVASALTTVLGLSMLFFASFGKFRSSGPAIGLSLLVTLAACLTLAPALLCAFGKWVFWPLRPPAPTEGDPDRGEPTSWSDRLWMSIALRLVQRPGFILTMTVLALLPLAICGVFTGDRVTFDFLSELPAHRTSIRGNAQLQRHFSVGEGGPVMVIVRRRNAGFESSDEQVRSQAMAGIFDLTARLSQLPGIESVRSLAEPLGESPKPLSLITAAGRRKLMMREHRITRSLFLSQIPGYHDETTRFELVLKANPFSLEAQEILQRVDSALKEARDLPDSFWHGSEFLYTGATAGIRDLRAVTRSDSRRIQLLVTAVVWAVLMWMFRDPIVCLYLVGTVLFSYVVTIGATELFFSWLGGPDFPGLDWKVPIFLFVILVAVGEDYNIYLLGRVVEEQQHLGPIAGLREGIRRTGGIITSCGVIMAGSFVSMTTGSLAGIAELGFALTIGVLIDTFVVRAVMVSCFLALWARRSWKGL